MAALTEWPSSEKLQQLRDEGEAPSSFVSTRAASSVAALAAIILVLAREDLHALVNPIFSQSVAEQIHALTQIASRLILIPAISAFLAALICTLFQTRFLYAPIRLIPKLMRNQSYQAPAHFIVFQVCHVIIFVICILICATTLFTLFGYDLLNSFNQPLPDIAVRLKQIWKSASDALIVCGVIICILAAVLNNIHFRSRNRMSRAELLSQREN